MEGRDKSAARTTVGGEFPTRALSIGEVGASFHHGPRFRRPPRDPGRWAFPSPVLTLASRRSPSHTARSLRADSHTPRHAMVCFHGRSSVPRPANVRLLLELPSAQSPLARARRYLARRGLKVHVSRVTLPSALLRAHAPVLHPPAASVIPSDSGSRQVAVSPCGEEDLPDVVSAHPSLRAWTPPPAALEGHMPVTAPTTAAFPPCGPGRRSTRPGQRLAARRPLRGCSHSLPVQARRCAHHPGRSYRDGFCRRAAVVSPSEPLTVCSLPVPRICLPSASGNGRQRTFTSSDAQPCRLLPERCGSGAPGSGSEARADAGGRRLHPVVRGYGPHLVHALSFRAQAACLSRRSADCLVRDPASPAPLPPATGVPAPCVAGRRGCHGGRAQWDSPRRGRTSPLPRTSS